MSGSHPGSPSPPRLNFLLHLDRDQPVEQAYSDAIELFRVAEDLGYDSGWVIQRHFRQGREHVSSPLPVLAAIAQHTTRIGLGTGVLVLPLEDPLRVAEDSATVDALSGGRLELGVGSGPFPGAWEAFGKDLTERQRIFGEAVTRLHEVLDGVPLNSGGESLHPSGAGVRRRLWQATTSNPDFAHASAAAAALAGDGLQLSRANVWGRHRRRCAGRAGVVDRVVPRGLAGHATASPRSGVARGVSASGSGRSSPPGDAGRAPVA